MRYLRVMGAWLAAVLLTTVLGSMVQTQFNLAELQALGVAIPPGVRLATTGRDLLGFGQTFGALVAAAFLAAFLVTGVLRRWIVRGRTPLYALAGFVAIVAMIAIMTALFELVPIAAARGPGGLLALALTGAAGGALFARLSGPRGRAGVSA